jgi:hypothetical protein
MIAKKLFENVVEFKYLGMTQINMAFTKKLRTLYILGMLSTIHSESFGLLFPL